MDGKEYAVKMWGVEPETYDSWGERARERWDAIARILERNTEAAIAGLGSVEEVAELLNFANLMAEGSTEMPSYKEYGPGVPEQYEKAARRYIEHLEDLGKLSSERAAELLKGGK